MFNKTPIAALAAASLLLIAGGCSATNAGKAEAAKPAAVASAPAAPAAAAKVDYTKMSSKDLAEYMIFETDSYDLKQATQEGTSGRAHPTRAASSRPTSRRRTESSDCPSTRHQREHGEEPRTRTSREAARALAHRCGCAWGRSRPDPTSRLISPGRPFIHRSTHARPP